MAKTAAIWSLVCDRCGTRYPFGPSVHGCPACSKKGTIGILEAEFRPAKKPLALNKRKGPLGLDRYRDLLPGGGGRDWISLGEGGTALIPSRHIGPALGLKQLYFKNESVNPTWSFKDRFVCVSINVAKSFGFKNIVVASTGNLGISVAAYAAAAGMQCMFVAPRGTAATILDEARRYGVRVIVTSAERRLPVLEDIVRTGKWFPIGLFLRRGVQNPFGIEGYKTFGYEMIEQLGRAPGAVLFPCARGNGLYGAYKGFKEAVAYGWAASMPKLIGCQPKGANSLEVSLERGAKDAVELPRVSTLAASATETVSSDHALHAIRKSKGTAASVNDADLLQATYALLREGLSIEPSSALPVACLKQLAQRRALPANAPVVCVLTAAGLRWPVETPKSVPPLLELGDNEPVEGHLT